MNLQDYQVGAVGAGGQIKEWSYWSSCFLLNTNPSHNLFTVQKGGSFEGTVQTEDDTNMIVGGAIAQAQHFTVRAIKVLIANSGAAVAETALAHFYEMLSQTTVDFLFPSVVMGQWVLQELLGAATLFPLIPVAGDNISQIQPRYHGIFPLNIPIVLPALQTFSVNVVHQQPHNADLNGFKLMISLAGRLIIGS